MVPTDRAAGGARSRRAVLGAAVFSAAGALTVIACTSRAQSPGYARIEDFGGRAAPGFDNEPALRRAAAAGTGVSFGSGSYELAAASLLARDAIALASGAVLAGQGAGRTVLRVVGGGPINHLFDAGRARGATIRDFTIVGNGVAAERAPDAGGLLRAILPPDATADIGDIRLIDCVVDNFASAAWVQIVNRAPSKAIRGIGTRGCTWRSRTLPPQAGAIGVPGHFVYVYGQAGEISDVSIGDVLADAAFMKGAVSLRGNVRNASVSIDRLIDAGREVARLPAGADGAGSYAVLGYATGAGAPRDITIRIGTLANPAGSGVYLVGVTGATVEIADAFGQRDIRDDRLPKGILALNQCRRVTARVARVADSARVLAVSLPALGDGEKGAAIDVQLGEVESRSGAIDLTVRAPVGGRAGGLVVRGRRSGPAAVGIAMMVDRRTRLEGIDLSAFGNAGAQQALAVSLPPVSTAVWLPGR